MQVYILCYAANMHLCVCVCVFTGFRWTLWDIGRLGICDHFESSFIGDLDSYGLLFSMLYATPVLFSVLHKRIPTTYSGNSSL